MLPKLAFFASTIDELQKELRSALEKALMEAGISLDTILVNVGDDKFTKTDDLREFKLLDTPESTKQSCWAFCNPPLRMQYAMLSSPNATMRCIGDGEE